MSFGFIQSGRFPRRWVLANPPLRKISIPNLEAASSYKPGKITQIKAHDLNLHLTVHGYNRGGLLVKWDVLHGFVPSSQLIDFPVAHKRICQGFFATAKNWAGVDVARH
jgi:hypothetical protein